ncbi:MAG: hypothetical protein NTZ78_14510, partial [Candidatus Aureabacteria bacterium]|nr:hypothetical protein [Candidatus Auribacterota bacterium]
DFAVPCQLVACTRPLCQFVFLRSRFCLPLLSASPCGWALRSATVAATDSGKLLSACEMQHMPGTHGCLLPQA